MQCYTRRSLGYVGETLARGQIFDLRGSQNDEKLLRLGYVQELAKGTDEYVCAECGARFIGMAERTAHGREDHKPAPIFENAAAEEAHEAHQEAALNQLAPLFLENTKASLAMSHPVATLESDVAKKARKKAKKAAKKARKLAAASATAEPVGAL